MKPFRTYRNSSLSLWQSSVAAVIKKRSQPDQKQRRRFYSKHLSAEWPTLRVPFDPTHPMMIATIRYCDGVSLPAEKKQLLPETRGRVTSVAADDPNVQARLSGLHHQLGQARIQRNRQKQAELWSIIKKYSNLDVGWAECLKQYLVYYKLCGHPNPMYRNWTIEGKSDPNFSVIQWQIPANGKIAIIADWGTGQEEAITVIRAAAALAPDCIINLGDTYYSGTPEECTENILIPLAQFAVNPTTKKPIPVFCLPGNHEYYSGGIGFYELIDNLNRKKAGPKKLTQNNKQQAQAASYFCLRSADNGWQFLGMDTGYNDHNAFAFVKDAFEDTNVMPNLPPNELDWHKDKLDPKHFSGRTILLSHHQLYSNNSAIGSPSNGQSVNQYLLKDFRHSFPNIGAWLWGHEHNLVVFGKVVIGNPASNQLTKGRCVGHSAIPVTTFKLFEDPYANNYPNIPVRSGYKLGNDGNWYNHGFEILKLNGKGKPINLTYYQMLPSGRMAKIGAAEQIR